MNHDFDLLILIVKHASDSEKKKIHVYNLRIEMHPAVRLSSFEGFSRVIAYGY